MTRQVSSCIRLDIATLFVSDFVVEVIEIYKRVEERKGETRSVDCNFIRLRLLRLQISASKNYNARTLFKANAVYAWDSVQGWPGGSKTKCSETMLKRAQLPSYGKQRSTNGN